MPEMLRRRTAWVAAVAVAALTVMLVVVLRTGGHQAVADTSSTSTDTVTVTGVGTASGTPDTLDVDFRVHVTRPSVQTAIDGQAAAAHRLLTALDKAGIDRRQVRTTDLAINRHYDNHGNVTGYDAEETVRASISPLREAGRTISAAATSSGNDVEVGQISFDIADDSGLVTTARANAFADGKSRAQQYADLAGRSLGRVVKVTESVRRAPAPTYYRGAALDAARAAATAAVPIRGGRQPLTVRVTVIWQLT